MLWSNCQKTEIENIKARENEGTETKLNLGGDGKFDSRGLYKNFDYLLGLLSFEIDTISLKHLYELVLPVMITNFC